MTCKYCGKPLNKTERPNSACFTCYDKLKLVKQLVEKCQKIKRMCER